MGTVITITKQSTTKATRKALNTLSKNRHKKQKKMSDFYGKLPNTYGDGITYQKSVRNEW